MSDSAETAIERWHRRKAIEEVVRPQYARPYEGATVAVDLALRYLWNVAPTKTGASAESARRLIKTPPITGDDALAVFCHEGGHIEDATRAAQQARTVIDETGARWRESLESECFAWRFAMAHLRRRWNATMQRTMESCLRTYQSALVTHYDQVKILEALFEEGRDIERRIVRLKPKPPVDLTRFRQIPEQR